LIYEETERGHLSVSQPLFCMLLHWPEF
jgi:hypothetical protein